MFEMFVFGLTFLLVAMFTGNLGALSGFWGSTSSDLTTALQGLISALGDVFGGCG